MPGKSEKKPRGKGRPFVKGDPRAGRPLGSKSKVTEEARAAASEIVDNPEYREKLFARALAGELPPAIEAMLWYYAKGKPPETLHVAGDGGARRITVTFGVRKVTQNEAS